MISERARAKELEKQKKEGKDDPSISLSPNARRFAKLNGRLLNSKDVKSITLGCDLPRVDTPENIYQARLRKERAFADQQEMKAKTMAKEQISAAKVERFIGDTIVTARDGFCRIGGEIGDRLAVETDPAKCAQIVNDKVTEVLKVLAKLGRLEDLRED